MLQADTEIENESPPETVVSAFVCGDGSWGAHELLDGIRSDNVHGCGCHFIPIKLSANQGHRWGGLFAAIETGPWGSAETVCCSSRPAAGSRSFSEGTLSTESTGFLGLDFSNYSSRICVYPANIRARCLVVGGRWMNTVWPSSCFGQQYDFENNIEWFLPNNNGTNMIFGLFELGSGR